MTRAEFLAALQRGLRDLPAPVVSVIVADYEGYFADGAGRGRDEAQVAAALGDPARLAAELVLATRADDWQAAPTQRAGWRALGSALGLMALDGLLAVPLGLAMLLLGGLYLTGAVFVLHGAFTAIVGSFDDPIGGVGASLLRGLGLAAGGFAAIALASAALPLLVNTCARRVAPRRNTINRTRTT